MGYEIERKWLADLRAPGVPALSGAARREIVQGYLCTSPVVRVRRDRDKYYLTYKGDGLLCREEYNLPLTSQAFEKLLPKCEGIVLEKTRYMLPVENDPRLTIELDIFHGVYEGLAYAEVEFPDEASAVAFRPPSWFGIEVTGDPAFTNAALSEGISAVVSRVMLRRYR